MNLLNKFLLEKRKWKIRNHEIELKFKGQKNSGNGRSFGKINV